MAVYVGTEGNDTLTDLDEVDPNNQYLGLGGDDYIVNRKESNDTIDSGAGNDFV